MEPGTLFSVGGLAAQLGVSPSAIRRWERLGLVPTAVRPDGNDRRVFVVEDIAALRERVNARRAATRRRGEVATATAS